MNGQQIEEVLRICAEVRQNRRATEFDSIDVSVLVKVDQKMTASVRQSDRRRQCYIRRAANNKINDRLRRLQVRRRAERVAAERVAAERPDFYFDAPPIDDSAHVTGFLSSLAPIDQYILTMRDIGKTFAEIAGSLGTCEQTVRNHMKKIIKKAVYQRILGGRST